MDSASFLLSSPSEMLRTCQLELFIVFNRFSMLFSVFSFFCLCVCYLHLFCVCIVDIFFKPQSGFTIFFDLVESNLTLILPTRFRTSVHFKLYNFPYLFLRQLNFFSVKILGTIFFIFEHNKHSYFGLCLFSSYLFSDLLFLPFVLYIKQFQVYNNTKREVQRFVIYPSPPHA